MNDEPQEQQQLLTGKATKHEDPKLEVGLPIIDTPCKLTCKLITCKDPDEESKENDMDPLLKILVSTLVVDALNEKCTEEEMA